MDNISRNKTIDYIELPIEDIKIAKEFYGGVFGWQFIDYGDEYTSFSDGRLTGGFRKEQTVTAGGPLIVFYSNQLEALLEKIRSSGGEIVQEIFSFPGGRRFHFQDPSGNELAVWSDF